MVMLHTIEIIKLLVIILSLLKRWQGAPHRHIPRVFQVKTAQDRGTGQHPHLISLQLSTPPLLMQNADANELVGQAFLWPES